MSRARYWDGVQWKYVDDNLPWGKLSGSINNQTDLKNILDAKQGEIYQGSTEPSEAEVGDLWIDESSVIPVITLDDVPTSGSNNAVKSSGIYTALSNKSQVSVSSTGTATDEVQYITIDGTEKKLAGGSGESIPTITVESSQYYSERIHFTDEQAAIIENDDNVQIRLILPSSVYSCGECVWDNYADGTNIKRMSCIQANSDTNELFCIGYFRDTNLGAFHSYTVPDISVSATGTVSQEDISYIQLNGYYYRIAGGKWGSITGTLSNQTDLQTALNNKQDVIPTITLTSSQVIGTNPVVVQFTDEQDAFLKNNSNTEIIINADSLGMGIHIFVKSVCDTNCWSLTVIAGGIGRDSSENIWWFDTYNIIYNGTTKQGTLRDADITTKTYLSSELADREATANKVTSLSSSSTDTQYPSAKCVYDLIGNVESLLSAI